MGSTGNMAMPREAAVARWGGAVVALLALLVAAPLLAGIWVSLKLGSRGSALFVQQRLGQGGRLIRVVKFRTMAPAAEAQLEAILARDPELRREYAAFHKLEKDPRVTPLGRWLRRYSLDELPQLWSVVRGDMALVGPRAYLPAERAQMGDAADIILQARPGLTGIWQTHGRHRLSFAERLRMDCDYVARQSPWLDCRLLLRTIGVVLRGDGI